MYNRSQHNITFHLSSMGPVTRIPKLKSPEPPHKGNCSYRIENHSCVLGFLCLKLLRSRCSHGSPVRLDVNIKTSNDSAATSQL